MLADLLHVDRASDAVDVFDTPELCPVRQMELVSFSDVRFLEGVGEAIDGAPRGAANAPDVREPSDRVLLVRELLFGEIAQSEELPPRCFLFTALPTQQIRKEPASALLLISILRLCWNAGQKHIRELPCTSFTLTDLFGWRCVGY